MRGTMLWFNETKQSGVITADAGERFAVEGEDFAGREPPRGRCRGTPVEFHVGVSLIVIVTPGQDTALTIRNSLRGQRRAGLATAAGVATGQASWTIATS